MLRDFFLLPRKNSAGPSCELGTVLTVQLCRISHVLYFLIKTVPLIHFRFYKQQNSGIRHGWQILHQGIRRTLKKAAVLHQDQTALRKKRHGVREADQLVHIQSLSLKAGKIHGIVSNDSFF